MDHFALDHPERGSAGGEPKADLTHPPPLKRASLQQSGRVKTATICRSTSATQILPQFRRFWLAADTRRRYRAKYRAAVVPFDTGQRSPQVRPLLRDADSRAFFVAFARYRACIENRGSCIINTRMRARRGRPRRNRHPGCRREHLGALHPVAEPAGCARSPDRCDHPGGPRRGASRHEDRHWLPADGIRRLGDWFRCGPGGRKRRPAILYRAVVHLVGGVAYWALSAIAKPAVQAA
jgi:hypothetical protein